MHEPCVVCANSAGTPRALWHHAQVGRGWQRSYLHPGLKSSYVWAIAIPRQMHPGSVSPRGARRCKGNRRGCQRGNGHLTTALDLDRVRSSIQIGVGGNEVIAWIIGVAIAKDIDGTGIGSSAVGTHQELPFVNRSTARLQMKIIVGIRRIICFHEEGIVCGTNQLMRASKTCLSGCGLRKRSPSTVKTPSLEVKVGKPFTICTRRMIQIIVATRCTVAGLVGVAIRPGRLGIGAALEYGIVNPCIVRRPVVLRIAIRVGAPAIAKEHAMPELDPAIAVAHPGAKLRVAIEDRPDDKVLLRKLVE